LDDTPTDDHKDDTTLSDDLKSWLETDTTPKKEKKKDSSVESDVIDDPLGALSLDKNDHKRPISTGSDNTAL